MRLTSLPVTSDALIKEALAADWACYSKPEDRADFERLSRVIKTFPAGFRVYFLEEAGEKKPVGYTGWHPVSEETFVRLHDRPERLTHRGQISPLPELLPDKNYLYLFNYSLVPELHKTPESRAFIKAYAAEIHAVPNLDGIAAVTVSPDGIRVAEKFGLDRRGIMTHDGVPEDVYAAYF